MQGMQFASPLIAILSHAVAAAPGVFAVALFAEQPAGAADAAARQAPALVKLIPEGAFRSVDGRPANMTEGRVHDWQMLAHYAPLVIQAFASRRTDMLVDYEHQTLTAKDSGTPAPASGWITHLEWLDGASAPEGPGLYGHVRWTQRARAAIEAGEYRYLSPVFTFDPDTGVVLDLLTVGLVNRPGLSADVLPPLVALAQKFSNPQSPETPPMKLLLAALGLSAAASEEAALSSLTALQGQVTALNSQVATLQANQFDPIKHIPLDEHKKVADQLAVLSQAQAKTEHDALMTAALADARILPANEAYWRAQPLAALQAFLKDAQPLAAALGSTQTGGKQPAGAGKTATLSAEEQAVCAQLGLSPEDYLKNKAPAAA